MDAFSQKFVEEAREFLGDLEEALLVLEENPEDPGVIQQVFRIMHTLKGNSSMFGYHKIDELTHELETLYDKVRNDQMSVTKDLLDLTLQSVDHIGNLLDEEQCDAEMLKATHASLLSRISILDKGSSAEAATAALVAAVPKQQDGADETTYFILFQPDEDILENGTNPLYLVDDFTNLGQFISKPLLANIPPLDEMDPEKCYTGWEIVFSTKKSLSEIHEVFIFVEDSCKLDIEKLADRNLLNDEEFTSGLTAIFGKEKNESIDKVRDLAHSLEKPVTTTEVTSVKKAPVQVAKNTISSIRVPSEKLDELMNLVSELVTNQASLSLLAEQSNVQEIISVAESMEKISRQLRENTFSICLIPIETIVTRFHRLVRDLSAELGKEVEFLTEGTETELDKNIIESLADPIMHILRNSLDHGIENKETRKLAGKPEKGKIILKAFYSGMNVFIQILDDGAGFNTDRIREKAISKGMITPEANLSDKELFDLLFLPGFSTASKVTDVSGRGVGMDVVKRKIEDLRGSVELDSKMNEGSTITIKLPLTLSIMDGLLVTIDNTFFVVQLQVVDKVYDIDTKSIHSDHNKLIPLTTTSFPTCT